jgi:hypothetical protein
VRGLIQRGDPQPVSQGKGKEACDNACDESSNYWEPLGERLVSEVLNLRIKLTNFSLGFCQLQLVQTLRSRNLPPGQHETDDNQGSAHFAKAYVDKPTGVHSEPPSSKCDYFISHLFLIGQ